MKKFVGFFIIVSFLTFTLYLLANANHQDLDITFVDDLDTGYEEVIKVCLKRSDGKLVLVDVEKHKAENIYLYILKLYDHYRNHLPATYVTPLAGNFEIIDLKKVQDEIFLELRMLYLDSGLMDFFHALMWSYQDLGINKLTIKINKETFTINKDANINVALEGTLNQNLVKQVIIYQEDDIFIPVTYFHQEDYIEFLLKKIISKFAITYNYEEIANNIIIRIDDENNLVSENVYQLLIMNLERFKDYDNIIIIVNLTTVYNN